MSVLGRYSVVKCGLFLISLLCYANTASAQIALGLKAGGNLATQEAVGYSTVERTTYHAGVMMNAYVADFSYGGFAIQPELLFSRKGCVLLSQNSQAASQEHVSLNYLELPVGFTYLIINHRIAPYITVAPFVSCRLTQKNTFNGAVDSGERSLLPNPNYNLIDFGIKVGVGIELGRFQLAALYSMGLNDVSKTTVSAYNRTFEFSLGYFIIR
jgi:hypothetical protein